MSREIEDRPLNARKESTLCPWRDPVQVASAFAEEPWMMAFLSDGVGDRGRWSYVLRKPAQTYSGAGPMNVVSRMLGPDCKTPDGPPFQGGTAGLIGYSIGGGKSRDGWPNLAVGQYNALLAFDHANRQVHAIGDAADWLDARPHDPFEGAMVVRIAEPDSASYEAAVAHVVLRIASGEIYQANIARHWHGSLRSGARPFDLIYRLAKSSPAPFAAYLRLPGLALVSNSPERFIKVTPDGGGGLSAETRPIKGTAARSHDPVEDCSNAQALRLSAKDRAENLMIVDLMRNDFSRDCKVGSVCTPELWRVETFANVHHLVSVVRGELLPGRTALDLMAHAFPPGSITGAPKLQAMKVIEAMEAPRGPFFGSMFWAGDDGALDSSVLIRTVAFTDEGAAWQFEARAGAGLVADSVPALERGETETKISAILTALRDDTD